MAEVKLTKNELKRQKDALKRFQRYLPTLQLKKQQLQMVIRQVEAEERSQAQMRDRILGQIKSWSGLLDGPVKPEDFLKVLEVRTSRSNIAGVDIPVFESVSFHEDVYDLFDTPPWLDRMIEELRHLVEVEGRVRVLAEQRRLLSEELRITTQRVNLFEKVKIPETRDNIRRIRIYLGDQQTAAVVRGKIAKSKVLAGATP